MMNLEITSSSHHGIYTKIMDYVHDLESLDLHRRQMAVLKNTMVEEWLHVICKRLNSYNEDLQECCIGANSIQKFARFLVIRRSLIKYYMTYREFCMCDRFHHCHGHGDSLPTSISDVLFESFLWVSKYKNHPRLWKVEAPTC